MVAPDASDGYVRGLEEYIIALEKRRELLEHLCRVAVKQGWTMARLEDELYADRLPPPSVPEEEKEYL